MLFSFLGGAAVLVLEIAAARELAPWFGSGLYAWTASITATLLALALGYECGGRCGGEPRPWVGRLLGAAAVWTALIPLFDDRVLSLAAAHLGMREGSFAAALALVGPPLAALAALGPVCSRALAGAPLSFGRAVGNVYFVSTLGSLAGALAASYWLVPSFRLDGIFFGTAAALVGAAACALGPGLSRLLPAALTLGALAWCVGGPGDPALLAAYSSVEGEVRVYEAEGLRVLAIDRSAAAVMDLRTRDCPWAYCRAIEALALARPGARRALEIGLGAGMLQRTLEERYGVVTDAVDANPAVVRAAREWFGLRARGRVSEAGGRVFVRGAPSGAYDLALVDAASPDGVPYQLGSREFFAQLTRVMKPGGLAVFNVLGPVSGPGSELWREVARAAAASLPRVRAFAVYPVLAGKTNNVLIFASAAPVFGVQPLRPRPAAEPFVRGMLSRELAWARSGVLPVDERNSLELDAARRPQRARVLWPQVP